MMSRVGKRLTAVVAAALALIAISASAEVYTGGAAGFGGEVRVELTVEEGNITGASIVGEDETPSIGGLAIEQLEAQIVERNGVGVEAVSGATATSNGVLTALQSAMEQAGLSGDARREMRPGTYRGSAHGFSCIDYVTVDVTVDENRIVSMELVDNFRDNEDSYENRYLCTNAFDLLSARMTEAQSVGVDSISGATGSSTGIKSAVRDALTQAFVAGGATSDEAEAAIRSMFMSTSAKVSDVVEMECDIVIVGAGASGVTAALTVQEKNPQARVLTIEKTARWGGQSMLTGGPKAYSPDMTDEQAEAVLEEYERTIENHRFGEEDQKWNDPDYRKANEDAFTPVNGEAFKAAVKASGNAIRVMMEGGIVFDAGMDLSLLEGMPADGEFPMAEMPGVDTDQAADGIRLPDLSDAEPFTAEDVQGFDTGVKGTSLSYIDAEARYLDAYEGYLAAGGQSLLETTATELLYEDEADRVITGVKAVGDDGTTYLVSAKAVVLATGGYGANPELVGEWTSGGGDWLYYGYQGNDGAGVLMALDAGANGYNLDAYPMSHQRMGAQFITSFELETLDDGTVWSPNDIAVVLATCSDGTFMRVSGEHFDPSAMKSMMGGFESAMGTYHIGSSYYVVYTEEQIQGYAAEGFKNTKIGFQNTGEGVPKGMALGDWVDKVFSQAEAQGFAWKVDSLEAVDEIMGAQAGSAAAAFEADGKAAGGRYYVMKGCGLAISSCGGIEVNEKMQAIRPDGAAIENLYVAGNDGFGNLMSTGAEYPIGGDAGMWCFASGYIAGEQAALMVG